MDIGSIALWGGIVLFVLWLYGPEALKQFNKGRGQKNKTSEIPKKEWGRWFSFLPEEEEWYVQGLFGEDDETGGS